MHQNWKLDLKRMETAPNLFHPSASFNVCLNKTTERNGSLDVRFDISRPKMDEWSIQFHVLVRNSNQTVWFGKFFDLKWRQIALKLSASIRFRQLRRNGQLQTFEISFREFNSIEIQQTNRKLNRICGNWSKMNQKNILMSRNYD